MDLLTRKEIEKLNGEKESARQELDVEKIMFKKKLMGSLGDEIKSTLSNPPKRSFWVGLKYRMKRRMTIRKENREMKRILKNKKKGGE